VFHKVRDDDRYDRAGPLEEKRGNFAVYDATENFAGYDATGNFAVYDATENFAGYDATGYLPEAPAPPRGEKRGDGDPAPPRGEKRGDGDRCTPAAPWEEMVATMLPFPTSIPVDNNDLKSLELSVDVVLVPCPWSLPNPHS